MYNRVYNPCITQARNRPTPPSGDSPYFPGVWGPGGIARHPSQITRNEGARGSSPRVGFSKRPANAGFFVARVRAPRGVCITECITRARFSRQNLPPSERPTSDRRSISAAVPETSPLDPLPVCLACWRERFGLDDPLPPFTPPPEPETCGRCGRPTTAGLYLLRGVEAPS